MLRDLRRCQRGVAAVEFAIIAPVFFALLLSIMDVGRYMWTLNSLQFAIDEAIRAGTVQELSDDDIEDRVAEALQSVYQAPASVVVTSDADTVTIDADTSYSFMFPISSFISNVAIELSTEMAK